ncbi:hypothetical protein EXS73_02760 [Candidatus Pacearchaeota archaeon]|nr:hypothetical protein [Candidatus Pacearchaeota archaeon]
MRIWYGVNGEGMGHAMRSAEIIRWLRSQGHTVQGYAGGKGSEYVRSVAQVTKIPHLHFIIEKGKVQGVRTCISNLVHFPFLICSFGKRMYEGLVRRPDMIITDYEPLTAWTAFLLRIPLVSIDNQHSITDADSSSIPSGVGKMSYQLFTRLMVPFPRKTLIFSFLPLATITPRATIVAPMVKASIQHVKKTRDNHFLLYLSGSNELLVAQLRAFTRQSFIVYGLNRNEQLGNVALKAFDARAFVQDLASCRGFITNGGMTSLSEALSLQKPILCVPLQGQYEQIANGHFLVQSKQGMMGEVLTPSVINQFQTFVKNYRHSQQKETLPSWKPILKRTLKELIS